MLTWLKRLFSRRVAEPDDAGEKGEQWAADFLRREKQFKILERNWRNPADRRDELDLICRDGETLVFVEVKARGEGALVPGYYAINVRKKKVLRRTAVAYLRQLKQKPHTFRLDVVEVILTANGKPSLLHFENIPLFGKDFLP